MIQISPHRDSQYRYLGQLFTDSTFVELRQQYHGRWKSFWFHDKDDLVRASRQLPGNLYTSLNHVGPDVPSGPIKNDDVDRYTRLLFDFDPVRPTDTPSTDIELEQANIVASGLVRLLSKLDWPEPLFAMSGNGFHLQYRTALPNTERNRKMLQVIYKGLADEVSTESVSFDPAVKNPGRICTLYGTVKQKGSATLERPHRSSWCQIPEYWRQVTKRQIEALYDYYKPREEERHQRNFRDIRASGNGLYRTLDVVSWLRSHGLYLKKSPYAGKHWVQCPWQDVHESKTGATDAVIWESEGNWPTFHCSHAHCADKSIQDLILLLGDADSFCSEEWSA